MTKKIAVINDLSGFGRCSLTAAISVISVMGAQACPLPTAILSAQTGYSSFYCDDYTEKMEYFRKEWQKMDIRFDGIYTGFVANEHQIEHIFRFLDTFYGKGTFLLVDPVMGDDGCTYKMFTRELLERMKVLAAQADVLTPNLTELCLLADGDFKSLHYGGKKESLIASVVEMAQKLIDKGTKAVLVTGIRYREKDGRRRIGNLAVLDGKYEMVSFPYIGGTFSGTGDLFASVVAGGIARGDELREIICLGGEFIECAIQDSIKSRVNRNEGVNYERYLKMLIGEERNEK